MAADAWKTYNSFNEFMGDGTIDLDDHAFNVILLTSSYMPNLGTQSVLTDINANELTAGNGYATGGLVMTGVTWTRSANVVTWSASDMIWTAAGGPIGPFRYGAIYDDTAATKPLVCYSLLDNTPADITFEDGNDFTISNPSGIFTLTGST